MKKPILFFVLFLFLLSLFGCKNDEPPTMKCDKTAVNLFIGDVYQLDITVEGLDSYDIGYNIDKSGIITVTDGAVSALAEGTAVITISLTGYGEVPVINISVTVSRRPAPAVAISGENSILIGGILILTAELTDLEGVITWSTSDEDIATVADGVVTTHNAGTVVISAACGEYSGDFEITVHPDETAPVFVQGPDFKANVTVSWNKEFDPLQGLKALDNVDGDITDKIVVVSDFDNQRYGSQVIELSVEDKAGNIKTMTRKVEVVWDYDVTFIGHAGSYYGIMNSEEAFLYAVEVLKYQALECDLKQTSDGVFVLSHDDTFNGVAIAGTPWSVLKDIEYTAGRNSGIPSTNGSVTGSPYTTKLCTLERYLEICKQYNVKAVIELKYSAGITNADQSRMGALMEEIERLNAREYVIFLGSQYNCLIWTRENGYGDIPCQYLVNSFESNAVLQKCIDYNLDISTNVTGTYSNNDEWLARYVDAGCKVSVYTFTQFVDYPEVQKWIDKGVDYVTCDWHIMSNLNLPEKSTEPVKTYKVIFKDYDGTVLKEADVREGRPAPAPSAPVRPGYTFTKWDKDITAIKSNIVVVAEYKADTYTITYVANMNAIKEDTWDSKEDFVDEFYHDFYEWLLSNGSKIEGITVSGNNVTVNINSVTVAFSDVAGIKAVDIYDFEKTLAHVIYKPVTRGADGSAVIVADENYFLNSNAYREKYRALDGWLYNCMVKSYPGYDKEYRETSAGKIQIFFRLQQWMQKDASWTSIPPFDNLPVKYIVMNDEENCELPKDHVSFTVEDEFTLSPATGDMVFVGWYLDQECTLPITKVEKGTTGNLIVYAKWGYYSDPSLYNPSY